MKIIFFLFTTLTCGIFHANAQANQGPYNPAYNPNEKICSPYRTDKDMQGQMKEPVKNFYDASKSSGQDKGDKMYDAGMNIYCNPPAKSPKSNNTKQAQTAR